MVVHMYSTCSFSSWQQQNIHLLSNKHLLYSIIINEWSSIQLFDNMLHVHENGQQGRLESRLVIPQNNFDKTLTFNRSSFHHSIQEINEIWYPRSLIITLPGHQVSLTSYGGMVSDWKKEFDENYLWDKCHIENQVTYMYIGCDHNSYSHDKIQCIVQQLILHID